LLRSFRSTLPDAGLEGLPADSGVEEALARRPDAVIVATPTARHLDAAVPAARAGCWILIEKPISDSLEGVEQLRAAAGVLLGYQFRFHPGLRRLRHEICSGAIGSPLRATVEWGEYLPSWHPWEDYLQGYAARRDLGGGVILTLCHPFDYLRWIFGEIETVLAGTANTGQLGIEVEDTADIDIQFRSGVGARVHLDYLARPARHRLSVTGTAGSLAWDAMDGKVDRETLFRDQMRHFLACVEGREQPACTLDDGIAALRIALAAKHSAAEGSPYVL